MTAGNAETRPLAWLTLLAIGACAVAVVSGAAATITYTGYEPLLRSTGLTLQRLRPIHESFAFGWVFLGGAAVVCFYLHSSFGPASASVRRRTALQLWLWTLAGVGILATLLAGRSTGREYLGYQPVFSVLILVGWILFAWNYFSLIGCRFKNRPAYIYMWSVAMVLFVVSFTEGHLYLIGAVSGQPTWDTAIQWKSNGALVGCFNLLAYGSLMYVSGRIRGDDSYAYSRTAFALLFVGLLNTFTNYGHHTFHLPQSAWIHWISFVVSMLEMIVLARVFLDLLALRRATSTDTKASSADWFIRSATLWMFLLLALALIISVPPVNALIHGTHVVVAHSMGSMLGIDSMILWAALAYMLQSVLAPAAPGASDTRVRRAIPFLSLFLVVFLLSFLGNGVATGLDRYLGPSGPDSSVIQQAFPTVMAWSGLGLAGTILWILAHWTAAILQLGSPTPPVPEH
jgi:nitric oxide reductase subunit B